MNGITHKQAQRYIRADLDGLLTSAGRLDLETHLRDCEACRADSESLSTLTARLQTEFHSRWDAQDGPSKQVMANVQSQSRRIHMQKRIDFAFNIFGGIVTLLVLLFVISSVVSQFQKKSITSNGTQTNIPASSPEERLLAFTSRQSGNYEIYIVRSDGSDIRNITNHSASDVNPAWSPDGKRIAFQSDRSSSGYYSQIFLMDADGSNVVLLTTDKGNHELPLNFYGSNTNPWSPDSSKLLFLRQGLSEGEWILQSIDIENGDITSLATGRVSFSDISWSPDGKYIWFVLNDPQNTDLGKFVSQIHIVSADGTNLINISSLLPSDETLVPPYNFYWSRDGKSISFSTWIAPENTTRENYTSKLYKVGINGSLTLEATTRSPIAGVWDGIYFISPPGPGGWTWVYPDGSTNTINPTKECEQERLYDSRTNSYTSAVASFSRSPNGNGVIIASCPDGNVHLSWVNSTGTEVTPITKLSTAPVVGYLDWVQWSQDDKFIVFHIVSSNTSDEDVYIVNIDESLKDPSMPLVKISLGKNTFPYLPAWQPIAGDKIAEKSPTPEPEKTLSHEGLMVFTRVEGDNTDIYTIRADGTDLKRLTNHPTYDGEPAWSPDGTRIAFESRRDHSIDIYTMNVDGSNLHQLTTNRGFDGLFQWSPDGQKIVYLSSQIDDPNFGQLVVMNADGSNKTALTDYDSYMFLGWSPNGQKIVYQWQNLETNNPQDNEIHIMDINGTNHYQWRAIIDEIKWIDNEHFVGHGWSGISEPQSWRLYKFDANGSDLIELATTPARIVALFSLTYLVEDVRTLAWYSMDGNGSPPKSQEFGIQCKKPGDRFLQETSHIISPDKALAFVIVHCSEGTIWFYLENVDGSQFVQLTDFMISDSEKFIESASWSPDGQYVTVIIASRNGSTANIYLFDIQKMLSDPVTQPIQLTNDGAMKYSAVWQPNP